MEENGNAEIDEYLNSTYNTKSKVPMIVPKFKRKSKIELAGKQVMDHLIELVKNTDLTYGEMASKINKTYGTELSGSNVSKFFHTNAEAIMVLAKEQISLNKVRAELYLEPNKVLVKDIKLFDSQINNLLDDEMLESDRKAKAIGDLLDKKGRLLLRHTRLIGRLDESKINIDNMQVNIFKQVESEKSDIINRLKKVEFDEKKIIDVPNENKNTNIN